MKVALVCDWYLPRLGGIELHLQDLAHRLIAAGHDVVVISPTPGEALVNGIRVVRIHAPLAPVFGFLRTPGGIRELGRALEHERPNVAHCHVSIVSPAALGGAFEAERRGIPAALTFHSIVPQMRLLARVTDLGLGVSSLGASMSAVSERVARDVSILSSTHGITIVPNGIDVGYWRVNPGAASSDALRVVTVMRLNAKKRPLALVDIMRRATAALDASSSESSTTTQRNASTTVQDTTPRITLRVVGDGPVFASLARAICRARLDDRIEMLGRRSRDEIRELLAASDVFLLPTVRESFGLAALEARCAGLPVIARAESGVAEIVHHDIEGLLGRSDAELASHLVTLARDPARRARIAHHNRTSTPPHDWPHALEANLALYREAISLRATARVSK